MQMSASYCLMILVFSVMSELQVLIKYLKQLNLFSPSVSIAVTTSSPQGNQEIPFQTEPLIRPDLAQSICLSVIERRNRLLLRGKKKRDNILDITAFVITRLAAAIEPLILSEEFLASNYGIFYELCPCNFLAWSVDLQPWPFVDEKVQGIDEDPPE